MGISFNLSRGARGTDPSTIWGRESPIRLAPTIFLFLSREEVNPSANMVSVTSFTVRLKDVHTG